MTSKIQKRIDDAYVNAIIYSLKDEPDMSEISQLSHTDMETEARYGDHHASSGSLSVAVVAPTLPAAAEYCSFGGT